MTAYDQPRSKYTKPHTNSLYNFTFLENTEQFVDIFQKPGHLKLVGGSCIDHRANSSLHSERMSAAEGSFFPHGATAVPLH